MSFYSSGINAEISIVSWTSLRIEKNIYQVTRFLVLDSYGVFFIEIDFSSVSADEYPPCHIESNALSHGISQFKHERFFTNLEKLFPIIGSTNGAFWHDFAAGFLKLK